MVLQESQNNKFILKNLQNLLFKVPINSIYGNTNILIENLSYDSRKIKNKSIFLILKTGKKIFTY